MSDITPPTAHEAFLELARLRAEKKARHRGGGQKRLDHLPTLPPRVWKTRQTTIKPPFSRLSVFYEKLGGYQRDERGTHVSDIADVLRHGGGTPGLDVVARSWEHDGLLWVVDGGQRYWAAVDADKDLVCYVHDVQSPQEEIDLFTILNHRLRVSPNLCIKNDSGKASDLIRKANAEPSHPLAGRIYFGSGGGGAHLAASSMICALSNFVGRAAGVPVQLETVSRYLGAGSRNRLLLDEFLRVLGIVFEPGTRPRGEHMNALAIAMRAADMTQVSNKAITRMKKVDIEIGAKSTKDRVELLSKKFKKALGLGQIPTAF